MERSGVEEEGLTVEKAKVECFTELGVLARFVAEDGTPILPQRGVGQL